MNLKQECGHFLLRAGRRLRCKGPENTLDSAQMLLRTIKTLLLDYGDSKEEYHSQKARYDSEETVARQYFGQTAWPRALYVRKARYGFPL